MLEDCDHWKVRWSVARAGPSPICSEVMAEFFAEFVQSLIYSPDHRCFLYLFKHTLLSSVLPTRAILQSLFLVWRWDRSRTSMSRATRSILRAATRSMLRLRPQYLLKWYLYLNKKYAWCILDFVPRAHPSDWPHQIIPKIDRTINFDHVKRTAFWPASSNHNRTIYLRLFRVFFFPGNNCWIT